MIVKKIINKFISLIKKISLFIRTPRLTILIFQIRFIERYLKIDLFFLSPRRLIIYMIEFFLLKNSNSNKFQHYGNYQLKKNMIPKNPIVYSGGVGTTIATMDYFSYDVSCTLDLSVGDYMEVFLYMNSTDGGACTVNGGSAHNEFTGYKILT